MSIRSCAHNGVAFPARKIFQCLTPSTQLTLENGKCQENYLHVKRNGSILQVKFAKSLICRNGKLVPAVYLRPASLTGEHKRHPISGCLLCSFYIIEVGHEKITSHPWSIPEFITRGNSRLTVIYKNTPPYSLLSTPENPYKRPDYKPYVCK